MTSIFNRYYDPATDQFLSIDPEVATTDQPYVFTNDDPLNAEDPTGLCVDVGGHCETAEAYDRAQAEAAAVKREEAAIAAEEKAAKKQLAIIDSYANGMPKESITYDNVAAAAKSYLGGVADKLSGQYAYLANLSYATYSLYKAYQASPFVGTLGSNVRVAVNWYRTSAIEDQAQEGALEVSAEDAASAIGLDYAAQDFLSSLLP